jgi:hypothetical protein
MRQTDRLDASDPLISRKAQLPGEHDPISALKAKRGPFSTFTTGSSQRSRNKAPR